MGGHVGGRGDGEGDLQGAALRRLLNTALVEDLDGLYAALRGAYDRVADQVAKIVQIGVDPATFPARFEAAFTELVANATTETFEDALRRSARVAELAPRVLRVLEPRMPPEQHAELKANLESLYATRSSLLAFFPELIWENWLERAWSPGEVCETPILREVDLLPHFSWVHNQLQVVRIYVHGHRFSAYLRRVDLGDRWLGVMPEVPGRAPRLPAGTSVEVAYEVGRSRFRFDTEVIDTPRDGRWRLRFPKRLRCSQRRLAPRVEARDQWYFQVRDPQKPQRVRLFVVVDLSPGGLGLEGFGTLELPPRAVLRGSLLGPFGFNAEAHALVAHNRPHPTRLDRFLLGTTLQNFGIENRERLARLLYDPRALLKAG